MLDTTKYYYLLISAKNYILEHWQITSSINTRAILYAGLFSSIFYFSQITSAVEKQNQEREYTVVNNLVVNNKNKYRTVIHKSEGKGILEMRQLINTSPIEECWIFLPHKRKWIEIGNGEEPEKKVDGRYITKARLDVKFMDRIMIENSNMVVYHFHPSHSLCLEEKIIERKGKGFPMKAQELEKERTKYLVESSHPSKSDLMSMIVNSMEFFKSNLDGNITFKIGSYYGVTEYHLTENGRAYFNNDNLPEFLKRIMKVSLTTYHASNSRQKIDVLSRIKMNPKQKRCRSHRNKINPRQKIDTLYTISKSIETMSNKYIKATFTPYEQKVL